MYLPSDDPRLSEIEPLGRGGTAEVVSAFHRDLKRRVAVKFALARPENSSVDFAALARREYDLIGNYRFPGLVRILEPLSPACDSLTLELCRGKTLDQLGRVDDLTAALNLLSALALDLEFLNAVGLVHGDLKPQNVFLPEDISRLATGRPGYVKLSDFSMGRRRTEHDRFRLGLGTVGYMAPETVSDATADHQSDLFALGVIAYLMLTGKHPFMHGISDPVEINSRVREFTPEHVSALRPEVGIELNELVSQLLARQPSERPTNALEVCRTLEACGATYPYHQALRPGHLLRMDESCEENIASRVEAEDPHRRRLDLICENSTKQLRQVLDYNLLRDNLEYFDGKFGFKQSPIQPPRLRRRVLSKFSDLSCSERKAAVTDAVGLLSLGPEEFSLTPDALSTPPLLAELLLPLLKTSTVKRSAGRLAKEADRNEAAGRAALLYLMAGSLADAERCAYQAAVELKRDAKSRPALALLARVIASAAMTDQWWEVRQLLMLRGDIYKESGEIEKARATCQQLIDLYADHPKDKLLALAHKLLGEVHRLRQDTDSSLRSLEESLAVFTELGDELGISHTHTNIGNVYWLRGDYKSALRNYRVALSIQKRRKAAADYASTLHNIATIYGISGRTRRGLFLLHESLSLKKGIGNLGEIARTLNNLGYVYQISGQPARAAENIAEALEINRKIGSKKELAYNLENLAELMISAGRLRESMSVLREGVELAVENGYERHLAALRIHIATVQKRTGQYGEARRSLRQAEQDIAVIDDKPLDVALKVQKASLAYHLGNAQLALDMALAASAEASEASDTVGILNSLLLVSRLSGAQEHYDQAVGLIEEQHLNRERFILDFGRLEYLIESGCSEKASTLADRLLTVPLSEDQDIEMPWMLNLCAEVTLGRGDSDKAKQCLERSYRLAYGSGLAPELIGALTLQGKIKRAAGDFEGAFADYKDALQMCKRTSDNIDEAEDRSLYQSKRVVRFLAGEIKLLSQRLGEKQRAG